MADSQRLPTNERMVTAVLEAVLGILKTMIEAAPPDSKREGYITAHDCVLQALGELRDLRS